MEKYAQGRLKTSECAEIVEQIHNQQNDWDKQQHGLTFQIKLLLKMMLDGVEKDEFEQKRRFAGKDDAVD